MNLAARVEAPELMDTTPLPPTVMASALSFLEHTNRWFGGTRIVLDRLGAWCRDLPPGTELTLLDAGCGAADIPVAVARWARRTGRRVRITAVESVPQAAAVARARITGLPEITVLDADVFGLLGSGTTYDFVTASLFLHHIPPDRTPAALRALAGGARRGLIVSDLLRSRPGYAAVWAASRLLGNAVVRHDGPLSVRRAFTVAELGRLAGDAGLPWLAARPERWFRVSLSGLRPAP